LDMKNLSEMDTVIIKDCTQTVKQIMHVTR